MRYLLLAVFVLSGTAINFLISKRINKNAPHVLLSGLRLLIGGSLLLFPAVLFGGELIKIEMTSLWKNIVIGVLLLGIPHAFIFKSLGEKTASEVDVTFIEASIPSLLIVYLYLIDVHFDFYSLNGILIFLFIIILFIGLLIFLVDSKSTVADSKGKIMLLIAALSTAMAILLIPIFFKRIDTNLTGYEVFWVTAARTGLIAVSAGIVNILAHKYVDHASYADGNWKWLHLFELSVIGTCIGWMSFFCLEHVSILSPVLSSSIFLPAMGLLLIPITTLLYGKYVLGKILSKTSSLGAVFILVAWLGIIITTFFGGPNGYPNSPNRVGQSEQLQPLVNVDNTN